MPTISCCSYAVDCVDFGLYYMSDGRLSCISTRDPSLLNLRILTNVAFICAVHCYCYTLICGVLFIVCIYLFVQVHIMYRGLQYLSIYDTYIETIST